MKNKKWQLLNTGNNIVDKLSVKLKITCRRQAYDLSKTDSLWHHKTNLTDIINTSFHGLHFCFVRFSQLYSNYKHNLLILKNKHLAEQKIWVQ